MSKINVDVNDVLTDFCMLTISGCSLMYKSHALVYFYSVDHVSSCDEFNRKSHALASSYQRTSQTEIASATHDTRFIEDVT